TSVSGIWKNQVAVNNSGLSIEFKDTRTFFIANTSPKVHPDIRNHIHAHNIVIFGKSQHKLLQLISN
ncbi:MAG: hypothetical protein LUE92_14135, partial [Clostridiales bacterium]|nr:hypothetical protein [Clostridiales bacterium]